VVGQSGTAGHSCPSSLISTQDDAQASDFRSDQLSALGLGQWDVVVRCRERGSGRTPDAFHSGCCFTFHHSALSIPAWCAIPPRPSPSSLRCTRPLIGSLDLRVMSPPGRLEGDPSRTYRSSLPTARAAAFHTHAPPFCCLLPTWVWWRDHDISDHPRFLLGPG
jgi:hypothetical protein